MDFVLPGVGGEEAGEFAARCAVSVGVGAIACKRSAPSAQVFSVRWGPDVEGTGKTCLGADFPIHEKVESRDLDGRGVEPDFRPDISCDWDHISSGRGAAAGCKCPHLVASQINRQAVFTFFYLRKYRDRGRLAGILP